MSERKSAEIKFRCTPTFKAGVQAAAEAAGQSMSEYIEAAVEGKRGTYQVVLDETAKAMRPYGMKPIPTGTITLNGPVEEGDIVRDRKTGEAFFGTKDSADDEFDSDDIVAVTATPWVEATALLSKELAPGTVISTPSSDPKDVEEAVARAVKEQRESCTCRPWEFCTHKATG